MDAQATALSRRGEKGKARGLLISMLNDPAFAAINRTFVREFQSDLINAYNCMTADGPGEFLSKSIIEYADEHWLVVQTVHNTYCGDAYPSAGFMFRIFLRDTGHPVSSDGWLARRVDGSISPDYPEALWKLLADRVARDDECDGVWRDGGHTLQIRPSRGGVAIDIELPHVVQACGDTVMLSNAEIAPFLTMEGKRALDQP